MYEENYKNHCSQNDLKITVVLVLEDWYEEEGWSLHSLAICSSFSRTMFISLAHFWVLWFLGSFFSSLHILHLVSCQLCGEQRFPFCFIAQFLLLHSNFFLFLAILCQVLALSPLIFRIFRMYLPLPTSKYFPWSFHLMLFEFQVLSRCLIHLQLIFL